MINKIKPRRCKVCNEIFIPNRPLIPVCSPKCAIEYSNKLKANKAKKEKSILKEKLKTLSDLEAEAKKSFQRYVRLRDKDLPCISCGNQNTNDWAGGHYFSAGMYSGLMFDERNCHKQCNTHCNKYLSGNLLEYRKGLIKRFGVEFVEKLESESDQKRNYKYTREELIGKKFKYDLKCKEIK
jgi:hypothetical protein